MVKDASSISGLLFGFNADEVYRPEDIHELPPLEEEQERKYLTLSWWLLHVGWKDDGERVRRAVEEVFEEYVYRSEHFYICELIPLQHRPEAETVCKRTAQIAAGRTSKSRIRDHLRRDGAANKVHIFRYHHLYIFQHDLQLLLNPPTPNRRDAATRPHPRRNPHPLRTHARRSLRRPARRNTRTHRLGLVRARPRRVPRQGNCCTACGRRRQHLREPGGLVRRMGRSERAARPGAARAPREHAPTACALVPRRARGEGRRAGPCSRSVDPSLY